MKKYLLGIVVAIAFVLPANFVLAQSSEEQYRALLIQLIISLQKQIAALSSMSLEASVSNSNDRCPNIDGIQSNIPSGLIYSRTFDKCVTEQELDRLEGQKEKDNACRVSEDNLDDLEMEYAETESKIMALEKKLLKDPLTDLKKEQIPDLLAWVESHSVDSTMPGMKSCLLKVRTCYSEESRKIGLEILGLEDKLEELETKIWRAELEVKVDCD